MRGLGVAALVFAVSAGAAEVELTQSVDRTTVGTEDTLKLTVVVSGAPESAQLELPAPADFEVLSRAQSTEMSYQLGGGGPGRMKRIERYTLVLRANRVGTLVIPPAVLKTSSHTYKTDTVRIEVKKGRLHASAPPRGQSPFPDPFRNFPFPGADDDDPLAFPEPDIPRGDSDLFLRAVAEPQEVFVGEQVTFSLLIYSRVDLSSVDSVTMPKTDGFWSESLESPTTLSGESRVLGGVPYREYLLRRFALFPMKAGTATIAPVSADITTGFLFAGHRVRRQGNTVQLKVKSLPPGAPPGFESGNVGRWRIAAEVSQTQVQVGDPVTVKISLEGKGNLRNVSMPKLEVPVAFKAFEPTPTEKVSTAKAQFGGRRQLEYLLTAQRTGTFTLPGLVLVYFDPSTGRYEESTTDPIGVSVTAGAGGITATGPVPSVPDEKGPKNLLQATGLKPLRHRASFQPVRPPLYHSAAFLIALAAAPVACLTLVAGRWVRRWAMRESPEAQKRRRAKAARARLAAAERLRVKGASNDFYGEVQKALLGFLEAKLDRPVAGLTRDALADLLRSMGASELKVRSVVGALEICDGGRFAPGENDQARAKALDAAAEAMEDWS